jgi:hypothetical protein
MDVGVRDGALVMYIAQYIVESRAEQEDFLIGDSCTVGAAFFSASSFVGVSH